MARETEEKELDVHTLRAGIEGVSSNESRGFYLVAEVAENTVGCLLITYEWSDWRNGEWWWLQSVYVKPDYRRLGVFRALYHQVEKLAVQKRNVIGLRLYVEKENHGAQQTYISCGMDNSNYIFLEKTLTVI